MICCLFAVMLLGPVGWWAMAREKLAAGPSCCTGNRRKMVAIGLLAISVAGLCLAGLLLSGSGPGYFRHICSVWTGP